jgi:hypothetical protein
MPVVVTTVSLDASMATRAYAFGARDFLEKPFDSQRIVSSLRSLLTPSDLEPPLVRALREEILGESATIIDTIREVEDTVRPCLALKQVRLNWTLSGNTPVRTFHDDSEAIHDVKTVLKEIILGALSELTNHDNSRPKTIDISVAKNGDRAQICFEDNFSPISQQAIESINNGIIVAPGKDFGRPWGLSVAQHLALRGGGRIRVQSSEEHSVITYSVPLADHA